MYVTITAPTYISEELVEIQKQGGKRKNQLLLGVQLWGHDWKSSALHIELYIDIVYATPICR